MVKKVYYENIFKINHQNMNLFMINICFINYHIFINNFYQNCFKNHCKHFIVMIHQLLMYYNIHYIQLCCLQNNLISFIHFLIIKHYQLIDNKLFLNHHINIKIHYQRLYLIIFQYQIFNLYI